LERNSQDDNARETHRQKLCVVRLLQKDREQRWVRAAVTEIVLGPRTHFYMDTAIGSE